MASGGGVLSAAGLDDYAVAAVGTPEEAVIRRWLAGLFAFAVRTGERHLEEGRPGTAAASFADAALLTDRAERFSAAVRRAYPGHFYRLYERRVTEMGLGHVLPRETAAVDEPTATAVGWSAGLHGRSPVEGSDRDDDDDSFAGSIAAFAI